MNRPARCRRPGLPLIAAAVMMLSLIGVASANASPGPEGVWSFNGGQIGVQRLSNGTYTGTVVVETKFAECAHPVGQQIWTGMTEQPDGSFWGSHQWYFGAPLCQENPAPGPTAWRVLEGASGSRYLRVCFSHPGTSQPAIAVDGSDNGTTYGCTSSSLTAPLPGAPGTAISGTAGAKERLTLPSAKRCLSTRLFTIHLTDPKYDPFKTVAVTLKGRKIATSRKGNYVIVKINLRGRPHGAFTIKIRATTVLGHHLSANRTYHTCRKKIKKSGKRSGKRG